MARYDECEHTLGPRLPHLFQRRHGWRNEVISKYMVTNMLTATVARAGIVDAAGLDRINRTGSTVTDLGMPVIGPTSP